MSARTTRRCPSCRFQVPALVAVRTTRPGPDASTNPRTGEPDRTTKTVRVCSSCAPAARTTPAPVRTITGRSTPDTRSGTGRRLALVPDRKQLTGGAA